MTRPEDALDVARAAAAERRAAGGYAEDVAGLRIEPTGPPDAERLLEWAVLEPDPDAVYSTRRFGAPITAVKRGLLRALRQYLGQLTAEQTRFNHHMVIYAAGLEERVRRLEAGAEESRGGAEAGLEERVRRLEAGAEESRGGAEAGLEERVRRLEARVRELEGRDG